MKLKNAKISILIGQNSTTIELYDADSSTTFAEITLTPEQLSSALSRLSQTPCECKLHGLDRIGKKMEHKPFEFEVGELNWIGREEKAYQLCLVEMKNQGLTEWKADSYFGSKTSFFEKEGKKFARATIRRWVDSE